MNNNFEENKDSNKVNLDKDKINPNYEKYIDPYIKETKQEQDIKNKKNMKYAFIYLFIIIILAGVSFLIAPKSFLKPVTNIKKNIQERDIFIYTSGLVNWNKKYLKKSAPGALNIENTYRYQLREMLFAQNFEEENCSSITEAYIMARKKIKIEVKSNSETNVDVNIYMFTKEDFNNAIKNALNSSNFRETLDKEIDNLKYEDKHTLNTEITFQELRKMWKPLFIKKYSDDLETIVFYSIFNIKPE